MIDYGLKDKVALVTGANNPWGIGATTALALAREGAKVVLVYKKIDRPFDASKTDKHGVDRYYAANAGDASAIEAKLKEANADYLIIESDISVEDNVKNIYNSIIERYGKVDILVKVSCKVVGTKLVTGHKSVSNKVLNPLSKQIPIILSHLLVAVGKKSRSDHNEHISAFFNGHLLFKEIQIVIFRECII